MTDWEAPVPAGEKGQGTVLLVYVLMLASVIVPLTGVLGVIIAYVYRDDVPPWLQSHFRLQIRTFWLSLLYVTLGLLLLIALVGYAVLLFWLVWFLVRCIKGVRFLNLGQAYPNPEAWLF
jgi:uncharacterized membrane protein